jgi:hypothetical protein
MNLFSTIAGINNKRNFKTGVEDWFVFHDSNYRSRFTHGNEGTGSIRGTVSVFFVDQRQQDGEGAALANFAFHFDFAAVHFHEGFGHAQAQT